MRVRRFFTTKRIVFGSIPIVVVLIFWIWNTMDNPQTQQDTLAIERVYIEFEESIRQGDFASAYELMSLSFRERRDLESFTHRFHFVQKGEESLDPKRFIHINGDKAFLFPKGASQRHGAIFEFEKLEGRWYLTGKIGVIHD